MPLCLYNKIHQNENVAYGGSFFWAVRSKYASLVI